MFTASLLLAAALAPADAPTPPPDAAVSDAGELQGEWDDAGFVARRADDIPLFLGRWLFSGTSAVHFDAKRCPSSPRHLAVNL